MKNLDSEKNILTWNRFLMPSMSKSEKRAAKLLEDIPEDVVHMTLSEYAENAGVSQATVLRFCRNFEVDGFPEFKMKVMVALQNRQETSDNREIEAKDSMKTILEKVFTINIQTLTDTLNLYSETYEQALEMISKANSIHFFGIGDAAIPAELARIKLRRLGIISTVNVDADMQLMTACALKPGDVAIAISFSGKTKSVVEAMRIAKEQGASTICITKMKKSALTKHCDISLFTATTDITVGKEIVGRRIAEQAIMEALYLGLAVRMEDKGKESIKRTMEAMNFNKY